ncbi:nephrocystin-3 [Colletotrichum spaethianum]|uniref:Nephrocystin-3 n=1 Tax=Colletotrichum spaethianum TaxID=700344 RepID=A0AA37PG61_9PEZI|nr:nephrocystin-3 [Colletotrichum spaethianum]GKT51713.1 nephrocystin-3 [Colletotrichum spaethianum]
MFTLAPILSGAAGVNHFVGRGDELRRLHETLRWTGERRTAVLHGLGGMGKTQLSIEYTKRHRSDYSAILWLNARDETSLKQSFRQAARRILREHPTVSYVQNAMVNQDLDGTTEAVKRWLDEARNDRWLVIYDNYDDVRLDRRYGMDQSVRCVAEQSGTAAGNTSQPEAANTKAYDIRPYFPETNHGAVVITTRSSTVKLGQLIRLSKLGDINDSLAILESTSNRVNLSQDVNANVLARRLDGLPLALSTAGAYLNQVSTTCAEYLQLYDESWLRLQRESPQLLDYDQALYSTWGVSFNHIQQQSRGAAMLLRLWAYFDNEDLWFELLQEAGAKGPDWLQDITEDKFNFNATIRVLCEHGLVEADPPTKETGIDSRGYSVHGCVHAWMIHVLNTGVDEEMSWTAMRCVASHVPGNEQKEYWMVQRRLLQHADRCINRTTTDTGEDEDAWVFHGLGNLYKDQGRLKEAEAMYERALQGTEKAWGPEHTSTLSTVNNLGLLYKSQGRLKEAEAMYERALQGKEKAWGPEHTSILSTVNNLGLLYADQGRLKEAEAMYERALQGTEKAWGPEHTSTLSTVNNLGLLYKSQGRLKEAEAMYERALQGKEKALGPEHTSTLMTVDNLGLLYADQGRLKEAEAMYQRALQGFEKAWGPEHTSTLMTVNNLGNLYADQGRLKEAEAMYQRALQGYEKALGPDAIKTYIPALNTLQNLGSFFEKLGENSKAISYYQQAQNGFLSVLGSQNERYTYVSDKIGSLQLSAQDVDIAPSVEKSGRGLHARWKRLTGHLKGP